MVGSPVGRWWHNDALHRVNMALHSALVYRPSSLIRRREAARASVLTRADHQMWLHAMHEMLLSAERCHQGDEWCASLPFKRRQSRLRVFGEREHWTIAKRRKTTADGRSKLPAER